MPFKACWAIGAAMLGSALNRQGMAMKRLSIAAASVAALIAASQASASGLDDWAKTVVMKSAVLKQAEQSCGVSNKLTNRQSLTLTYGRAAVEQSVPISQLTALDEAATSEATAAARGDSFCVATRTKTTAMVAEIRKAGQAIEKRRKAKG